MLACECAGPGAGTGELGLAWRSGEGITRWRDGGLELLAGGLAGSVGGPGWGNGGLERVFHMHGRTGGWWACAVVVWAWGFRKQFGKGVSESRVLNHLS